MMGMEIREDAVQYTEAEPELTAESCESSHNTLSDDDSEDHEDLHDPHDDPTIRLATQSVRINFVT